MVVSFFLFFFFSSFLPSWLSKATHQFSRSLPRFDGSALVRYSGCAGWSSLVARRAHNPKVVSSNLTPATISKTCPGIGLRYERRANWCFRFIAQFAHFKSQPSFLAPFPPISLVVPQLSRVEVDQVLRMA